MSEYWEIILAMTVFSMLILMQINRLRNEMNNRLRKMQGDLWKIEDKADGVERHHKAD